MSYPKLHQRDEGGGAGEGGQDRKFISNQSQQPPSPPPSSDSPTDFPGAIVTIILVITFVVACCLGVLFLWLSRRRAARNRRYRTVTGALTGDIAPGSPASGGIGPVGMGDENDEHEGGGGKHYKETKGSPRKLRKRPSAEVMAGWPALSKSMVDACGGSDEGPMGRGLRKHLSMPLPGGGRPNGWGWFGHGRSKSDVAGETQCGLERGFSNRREGNWLDDGAPHLPERGSWDSGGSSRMMALPTLPRVHHTVHGYPYLAWDENGSEEALLGSDRVTGYGNLRAFAREIPQVPRRVLVKQGHLVRSTTRASLAGYQRVGSSGSGFQQVQRAGTVPGGVGSPGTSPARRLPRTPSKTHVRTDSTDTILTEILRSTEKRLRSGSVGTAQGHVRKRSASRLGQRTASRSRTPSPKKYLGAAPSTPSRDRQVSGASAVSADSLVEVGQESFLDSPAELTTPRRDSKREPERQIPVQSVRSSISSSLSTVISEDEMPEEVRKAIMPLDGFVVQPQRAANIKPPVFNDPFVTAPAPLFNSQPKTTRVRPHTSHGWPSQQQQDLTGRRMTLGPKQPPPRPAGELILAPGPGRFSLKAHPLPKPPSFTMDDLLAVPFLPEAPPPSSLPQSRRHSKAPTGPLFLRLTKTSTLSTIPVLPPPIAPGLTFLASQQKHRRRTISPVKTVQFVDQLPQEPETDLPTLPDSPTRSPKECTPTTKTQKHSSVASSIYSQASFPPHAPSSPIDISQITKSQSLNEAAVSANSQLSAPGPAKEGDRQEVSDLEDRIPGITSTIMSLRRMNSQMSTASSLMSSVPDRRSPSPLRVLSGLGKKRVSLPQSDSAGTIKEVRKSMGSRNYLTLGVGLGEGGGGGGGGHKRGKSMTALTGNSGSGGETPPSKKRKPAAAAGGESVKSRVGTGTGRRVPGGQRGNRLSMASSVASIEERVEKEGREREGMVVVIDDDKENEASTVVMELLQAPAGEFTFEVCGDEESGAGTGTDDDDGGEKEGRGKLRIKFPWDLSGSGTALRRGGYNSNNRNNDSPSRGSVRSVDSLGLYDRQGFLIPGTASPVRPRSPGKLRR